MKSMSSRSCRLCPGILSSEKKIDHNISYSCKSCDNYKVTLRHPKMILRLEEFLYDNKYLISIYYIDGKIDFYHACLVNKFGHSIISKIYTNSELVFNPQNPTNIIDKLKTLALFL